MKVALVAVDAAKSNIHAKWIVAVVGVLQLATLVINVANPLEPPFARWTLGVHGIGVITAYVCGSRRLSYPIPFCALAPVVIIPAVFLLFFGAP